MPNSRQIKGLVYLAGAIAANASNSPIVPRSLTNPVGQTDRINRTTAAIVDSLDATESWLLSRFNEIPVAQIVVSRFFVNKYRYEYQISIPDLERLVLELQIELGRIPDEYVVQQTIGAYEIGTDLAVTNLANLTDDYTRNITQVLLSEPWQRRVALVGARVFEEMAGFEGDAGVRLSRILRQAVQDGMPPSSVVESLQDAFGISKRRAKTISQTEITGALRRGRWDEAQDANDRLGIRVGMLWISALKPTTRLWHASRHGSIYTIQDVREFYAVNGNAINCFLPDTKVSGRFVAGSKAHYSGNTVNIMTGGGRNITVTPNHPIMTGRGMVAAAEITESDYLVAYIGEVENPAGVSDLHGNMVDSAIENVFCALSDIGHSVNRVVIAVNFHGDGRLMDKDVNIVNIDGVLPCATNASVDKVLDDLAFVKSNPSDLLGGAKPFGFFGVGHSANRIMGFMCNRLSVFFGGFGVSDILSRAHASPRESEFSKVSVKAYSGESILEAEGINAFPGFMLGMNGENVKRCGFARLLYWAKSNFLKPFVKSSVCDSDRFCHALHGLAGLAALDKVVKVNKGFFTGHVYDLQEVSGIMIANGIIASNCYCSQTEILLDKDGKPVTPRIVLKLKKQKDQYFGE